MGESSVRIYGQIYYNLHIFSREMKPAVLLRVCTSVF